MTYSELREELNKDIEMFFKLSKCGSKMKTELHLKIERKKKLLTEMDKKNNV